MYCVTTEAKMMTENNFTYKLDSDFVLRFQYTLHDSMVMSQQPVS